MSSETTIRGIGAIAAALDRSPSTIWRWIARGILPVWRRAGPFPNSEIIVRCDDVERLRRQYGGEE
jgi:hypothetical protein